MKEVIISAYKRDYSWINNLNSDIKATVYRKGENFNTPNEIFIENNVGRDVHTFFNHFVERYDTLSEYTFTTQDYFEDHVSNYLDIMNGNKDTWDTYAQQVFSECWFFSTTYPILLCDRNGRPHHDGTINLKPIWDKLFLDPCPETFRFTPAGHFCVSKSHVRKRPIGFYKDIVDILETDELSPWVIERLMPYIFDLNYKTKKNYDEIKNENVQIEQYVSNVEVKYTQFTEDVFVIDSWPNTIEKEKVLVELINKVKVYGCPIILAGHYPVKPEIQKLVDYYIYDGNNDVLLEKDFSEYGVHSDRWTDLHSYVVTNKNEFHHDYAIWLTMKNAFKLAEQIGKKYIHFLEYDNLPDEIQYRQAFMEYIRSNDAVVYEYSKNSTKESNPYCATYIYSIRTEIANKLVSKINSKEEFFKNKNDRWQLEKNFYQNLKEITNSVFVSKYIPNNNEFNLFAVWNRNGILRGGARIQSYLGVDDANQLFIHIISGFHENPADKDYLVEITYGKQTKFMTIHKGGYYLEKLGEYEHGQTVNVYHQGVNIFQQALNQDVSDFKRMNKITRKNVNTNRTTNIFFIDGPFVEIKEDGDFLYNVQFINKDTNKIEFEIDLKSNHWAKSSKKYYVNWLIKIKGVDNDFYYEHDLNLENQRVFVCFESKSLGDNLAWIPYVEKLRIDRNCKVIVSTFHNDLFKAQYPEIEFVTPGSNVNNIYALYRLGFFYDGNRKLDMSKHPSDPRKEPLMKVATDILGISYEEIKPKLAKLGKKKKKMVCIAVHSTAQCKYWNNPTGWQDVVDHLKGKGYEVRLLSREEDGFMGNKNPKGVIQQPKSTTKDLIKVLQESEFFIGISSGLSWLAWASGTPTVIISGFTDEELEPINDVVRIINKEVCNSCWSTHEFDAGDWNWCPVNKGTEKEFECSKTISSDEVIMKIDKLIKNR